jgi:hypothetical protein
MAPKKKEEQFKRKHKVQLYFDDYEWGVIKEKHKLLNIRLNLYLRTLCVRGYYRQSKYPKVTAEAIAQLSRMGGLFKEYFKESGGKHADLTAGIIQEIRELIKTISTEAHDDRKTDTATDDAI